MYCFTTVVWAVLFLEPRFFLQMFTKEPGILQYGVSAMRIYFCGIFMMALQFAGQSTAVALNRAKQAVFFSLFRKVIIVIPLTMLLPMIGNLRQMECFGQNRFPMSLEGLHVLQPCCLQSGQS